MCIHVSQNNEMLMLLLKLLQVDEDMRVAACQTLQHLVSECAERREEIVSTQLNILTTQIQARYKRLFIDVAIDCRTHFLFFSSRVFASFCNFSLLGNHHYKQKRKRQRSQQKRPSSFDPEAAARPPLRRQRPPRSQPTARDRCPTTA